MKIKKQFYPFIVCFSLLGFYTIAGYGQGDSNSVEDTLPIQSSSVEGINGQTDSLVPEIGCLQNISEVQLKKFLEYDFGVRISKDSQRFDRNALMYLYIFLTEIAFNKGEPVVIQRSDKSFKPLVQISFDKPRNQRHVTFSSDAFEETFLSQIDITKIKQKISFTNELFTDLANAWLSDDEVEAYLQRRYAVNIGRKPGTFDPEKEIPLKKDEIVLISEALSDLPKEMLQKVNLKRVTRAHPGIREEVLDEVLAGTYQEKDSKIMLHQAAYEGDNFKWTFYHELGHAVFSKIDQGTRNVFNFFSWKKDGNSWKAKSIPGYLTYYARKMESPSEDFAESFAAYLLNPIILKKRHPEKYKFLNQKIFLGREYEMDVKVEGAKAEIISSCSDSTPPSIDPLKDIIITQDKEQPNKLYCHILFDDENALRTVVLSFLNQNENLPYKDRQYNLFLDGRTPKAGDRKEIRDTKTIEPERIFQGPHILESIHMEDSAGNRISLPGNPSLIINLAGKPATKTRRENILTTMQTPTIVEQEGDEEQLIVPVPHVSEISEVTLIWKHRKTGEQTKQYGNSYTPAHLNALVSQPGEKNIRMRIAFPLNIPEDQAELVGIQIRYDETTTHFSEVKSVSLTNGKVIKAIGSKNYKASLPPKIIVDQIKPVKHATHDIPGKKSGEDLTFEIPVTGFDEDRLWIDGKVRDPSGQERVIGPQLTNIAREENGIRYHRVSIWLPKGAPSGTYLLDTINVTQPNFNGPQYIDSTVRKGAAEDLTKRKIGAEIKVEDISP